MSHPTTVRFEDTEYRRLEEMARTRGTTVSELVREAVRNALLLDENRRQDAEELMEYVRQHPSPVEEDVEELDDEIQDAMGDAAGRQ